MSLVKLLLEMKKITSVKTSKPKGQAFARILSLVLIAAAGLNLIGCESSFVRIDRRTTQLLSKTSAELGGVSIVPRAVDSTSSSMAFYADRDIYAEQIPTMNPAANELTFTPAPETDTAEAIMARLQGYADTPDDAITLDLEASLSQAIRTSREYRFDEEEYILACLRLLIERHRWGPRFFNEVSATVDGEADNGNFETALRLVNEFRVTQRLPYGGEVSARALVRATEDLHRKVSGEGIQSADIILGADIPLLRGAGNVAREDRIQAERDLIYAARDFERSRREFLFVIARDFLNLVVQQQAITNSKNGVLMREDAERRAQALVIAGREPPFGAAQAVQATLEARDRLNQQQESYRLSVDRFKIRLGLDQKQHVIIEISMLNLPAPESDLTKSVLLALNLRLDLQNRRDQLDDAKRAVENARNNLLPDLDFSASVTVPTDDERERAGLDFKTDDSSFLASITFGLPLDREIERLNLRQAGIRLQRAIRDFGRFRDTIAVDARAAVRDLDRARFSVQLQDQNRAIAQRQVDSIAAAPDRATALERSRAIDDLNRARDAYDSSISNLQIGILQYLLDSGQLRVDANGSIQPLNGMILQEPGGVDNPPDGS